MAQPAPDRRGFGALVTTEVDRIALGTHHGHELHARVERRTARFSAGRAWHLSFAVGRTRPVAIEVSEVSNTSAPGARYALPVVTTDPWLSAARRLGLLAISIAAVLVIAHRYRR